jgi:hypothetical protein
VPLAVFVQELGSDPELKAVAVQSNPLRAVGAGPARRPALAPIDIRS